MIVSIADPTRTFVMVDGTRIAGIEFLQFDGGDGNDRATGGAFADELSFQAGNDTGFGGGGADTLYGEDGNDKLIGQSGNDLLIGNDNRDSLYGGDGNDEIDGGAGNDRVFGGAGKDRILFDNNYGSDTADGGAGIDRAEFDFYGSLSGVTIKLLAPTLVTTTGGVTLRNIEQLTVAGSSFADTITGGAMADDLAGKDGDDRLNGRDGADDLHGGSGLDTLTGGGGADKFIFDAALASDNVDRITDFTMGTDRILLDKNVFGAIVGTDLAANQFHIGVEASTATQRIIYDNATGALYFDSDGTGWEGAVQFATLDANLALTHRAFDL